MEKTATKSQVLTVNQAAQRLRIRLESVYRLLYAGLLAGERVDGKWAISQKSVENYATKHSRRERSTVPLRRVAVSANESLAQAST